MEELHDNDGDENYSVPTLVTRSHIIPLVATGDYPAERELIYATAPAQELTRVDDVLFADMRVVRVQVGRCDQCIPPWQTATVGTSVTLTLIPKRDIKKGEVFGALKVTVPIDPSAG